MLGAILGDWIDNGEVSLTTQTKDSALDSSSVIHAMACVVSSRLDSIDTTIALERWSRDVMSLTSVPGLATLFTRNTLEFEVLSEEGFFPWPAATAWFSDDMESALSDCRNIVELVYPPESSHAAASLACVVALRRSLERQPIDVTVREIREISGIDMDNADNEKGLRKIVVEGLRRGLTAPDFITAMSGSTGNGVATIAGLICETGCELPGSAYKLAVEDLNPALFEVLARLDAYMASRSYIGSGPLSSVSRLQKDEYDFDDIAILDGLTPKSVMKSDPVPWSWMGWLRALLKSPWARI